MLSGAPKRTKVRATFNLPYDLIEEARDTVVALAGPPQFPARTEEVRAGRPIG